MLKKSLAVASLLIICAVAWVGAQEGQPPSILSKPIQSGTRAPSPVPAPSPNAKDLSAALKSAQQQASSDYAMPQPSGQPRQISSVRPQPLAQPASFSQQSTATSDDLEVPAVLSGRKPEPRPAATPVTNPAATSQPTATAPARPLPTSNAGPATPLARPLPTALGGPGPIPTAGPATTPSGPQAGTQANVQPSTSPTASLRQPVPSGNEAGIGTQAPRVSARTTLETPESLNRARPISIGIRGPALRVDAVGPGSISVGKAADYQVSVVNVGALPAENVLVAIDFPANVNLVNAQPSNGEVEQTDGTQMARVIWTVSQIAAGGEQQLALKLTPTQNQPFDLSIEWTLMPMNRMARIEVTQPKLDLEIIGPSEVLHGQQAAFKFEVTNTGTGAAENVVVELPGGLGAEPKNLGTIGAGQSRSFEIEIAAVEAGEVELPAVARGEGGLVSESTARFVVRQGRLAVAATGPEFKYAGTVATYDLVVTNSGDADATSVIAAAALPQGADYVDGVPGAEKVEGGIRWDIGKLSPGEKREYAIRCILNTAGDTRFEAGARGEGGLNAADQVATKVEAVADLTLSVEDPQGPKPVGEVVTYKVIIKNRGSEAATQVNLLAQFSDGIEPVNVKGQKAELVPGQAIFDPIARIGAGEQVELLITAKASVAGNHVFRAEMTCTTPETRRLFEGNTKFFGAAQQTRTATPATSGGGFQPSTLDR